MTSSEFAIRSAYQRPWVGGHGRSDSPNHSTVGMVKNLRDEIPVNAPHGGIVVEWLVENGDPVAPGQPLLRLHPIVETADATDVTR